MGNKRRPQGEGMVRKREDGRWEGRIVIGHKKDGTPMYKSVFGKSQKATLKQLHLLINLYRDVDLTEECRMTLGKWMDKWLDEYMIFKIKEKTMDGYRSIAEHQIKRFIGDKQLAYLTTADIQKFYNKIRKEGRVKPHPLYGYALSDSVVRKIHMTLHEALEEAVIVELLRELKKTATCEWIFPSPVKDGEPRHPSAVTKRFRIMLERAHCKHVRFHDLRHTFATMALENGIDVKTLSAMIGHVSAETTLNIYSHVTDEMRVQAAVRIDREIGGTDAQLPEPKDEPRKDQTSDTGENFEPYKPKIRKSGTGCMYQVNERLWEGSFYPRQPDGKRRKFNVYAKTREECEKLLQEMIIAKKAEIAELKKTKSKG